MTQKHELEINTGRRSFLRQGLTLALGATAMTAMPSVFAGTSANKERVLSFYNIHTGEKSKVLYWSNGIYVPEGVEEINHVLRDHYSGRVAEMDVRLMDALYNLHDKVDSRHSFEVISGIAHPKQICHYAVQMARAALPRRAITPRVWRSTFACQGQSFLVCVKLR